MKRTQFFSHPLGSAAAAPAPSLKRRDLRVGRESVSVDDLPSHSDDDTGSIALYHGSGSDFGPIPCLPALERISATALKTSNTEEARR